MSAMTHEFVRLLGPRWRLSAADVARLVLSGFMAVCFVVYARLLWHESPDVPLAGMVSDVLAVVGTVTAIVMIWRPVLGAALSVPSILSCLLVANGMDLPLLALIAGTWAATRSVPHLVAALGACAGYLAMRMWLLPPEQSRALYAMFSAAFVGLSLSAGLVVRHFGASLVRDKERIAALEATHQRVRAEERAALARELHDVVAHQLSIVSLQVLGHGESGEAEELQGALRRIDASTRTALAELRSLVNTLREDDGELVPGAADASPLPSSVAAGLAETLSANGYRVETAVDEAADAEDGLRCRTVCRILQEASTNILRHAPSGARCGFVVRVEPQSVEVFVRSDRAGNGRLSGHSIGVGLQGLAERVALLGGTFSSAPSGGHWIVSASLPRR